MPHKADAVIQIEDTTSLEKDSKGKVKKIQIVGSSNCGGSHSNKIKIEIGQDVNQAI